MAERAIEDLFDEAARRVEDMLDAEFVKFQSGLSQTYPDLSVEEYLATTANYLGQCEASKQDFLQRFDAELNS